MKRLLGSLYAVIAYMKNKCVYLGLNISLALIEICIRMYTYAVYAIIINIIRFGEMKAL